MRIFLCLMLMTGLVRADGEPSGEFDYYVLSLSWTPTWCAIQGDARGSVQCRDDAGFGWVLHGLWPQYETGWPSYCRTVQRDPVRSQTVALADIMGSAGSAWHQWKKHGRCSGLPSSEYFELARNAYGSITRPAVFRKLQNPITLPASVIERAFLEENSTLGPDMIAVTCKRQRIQEVRICLDRSLEPRRCGNDVIHDCQMTDALFEPLR